MTTTADRGTYSDRDIEAIRSRWDARAASWDECVADPAAPYNEGGDYERFLRFAREVIARRKRPAAFALDLGCGTGLVTAAIAPHSRRIVGVDLSPKMIAVAREKSIVRARFIEGDVFSLPFANNTTDLVVSRGVLLSHYGPAHAGVLLAEIRRILAPEGSAVLDYFNAEATEVVAPIPRDKAAYTGAEMLALADCARLGVRSIDAIDGARTAVVEFVRPG